MSDDWQEPENSGGNGYGDDGPSSGGFGNDGDGDGGNGGRGGYRGGRGGGRGRGRGRGGGRNYGDRDDGDDNNGGDEEGGDSRRGGGGRGRGRGGFRGGGRGGGGDGNENNETGEENNNESKPTEQYRPEEMTEEKIFEDRAQHYGNSGINFDAYEDIPVQSSDNRTTGMANTFEEMGLRQLVLDNLAKVGYKKPTPIQKHGSPVLLGKQDLMACAQTGSGKTAGFLLPIIHHLMTEETELSTMPCKPLALILAPTRELAIQIEKEAHMYSAGSIIKCRVVYGGTVPGYQRQQLRNGCHILVATPGRLKMFLNDRAIDVSEVKFFVLDEADRMLDQGFMPDVREIVSKMPPKGQRVSAMFSATFPPEIQQSAMDFLENYVFVTIGVVGGACADVQQIFYQVEKREKRGKVMELLRDLQEKDKVLIFTNSKKNTDFLAGHLSTNGVSATSIHGDRLQSQRERALGDFISGNKKVLVATAVAARGLDIPKVSMVINYEMPTDLDEYIHRIGRTGRVGHAGKAISFFDPGSDEQLASGLVSILKNSQQEIPDFFDQNAGGSGGRGNEFGATDSRVSQPQAIDGDEGDW